MQKHYDPRSTAQQLWQITFILALLFTPLILMTPGIVNAGTADTIIVDTLVDENDGSCTDGDCSLRDALDAAGAGDTVSLNVTGTLTLTQGEITVDKNVTLQGPGDSSLTISGDSASRIFWIEEDVVATITDITLADGQAQDGGGIFNRGGILTVQACTLTGNNATYDGGAIGNRFDGVLTVVDSLLISNTARHGAGIDNRDTLIVSGVTFNGNSARTWGGGIYNYTGVVTVTNSTFTGNGMDTDAGGGSATIRAPLTCAPASFPIITPGSPAAASTMRTLRPSPTPPSTIIRRPGEAASSTTPALTAPAR